MAGRQKRRRGIYHRPCRGFAELEVQMRAGGLRVAAVAQISDELSGRHMVACGKAGSVAVLVGSKPIIAPRRVVVHMHVSGAPSVVSIENKVVAGASVA